MTRQRRESPVKRRNPSGAVVWVARYTKPDGSRVSAGTFKLRRDAQTAIDLAYERAIPTDTVGAYAAVWTHRHPRAARTNATNAHRISRVLDVAVDGLPLRDWPLRELRRRHALALVDHMLTVQGRSASGAVNILRALSAMSEDAITDELAGVNAFKGVRVRASDPRVTKQPKAHVVFTFAEMHAIAAAAGAHESAIRVLSDCGLRLGELLALERRDYRDGMLHLRGSAHEGVVTLGDQPTKRHVRSVPVPPGLAELLSHLPARLDTRVLFPTPTGCVWWESNWRRSVWIPARDAAGMADATPHALRHSWITNLRAAGVDPADLAAMAGHSVETATAVYTHALNRSYDAARKAVG
jgi:integrase